MKYLARSEKILQYLQGVKFASFGDISKIINISSSTLRRDLKLLIHNEITI